jgi:hypothetical protein
VIVAAMMPLDNSKQRKVRKVLLRKGRQREKREKRMVKERQTLREKNYWKVREKV